MTAAEIEALAREYATTRPAALRLNYGVQRTENGGTAVRAIAMLPALTGAWKYRGGGGVLSTSGAFEWDKEARGGRTWRWLRRWAAGADGEYVRAWVRRCPGSGTGTGIRDRD
jgi:anaerobic selenocysteine-containing dehydrogenase